MKKVLFLLILLMVGGWLNVQAEELEDWQIQAGDFITASDVSKHNQLGQDLADIMAAARAGDWANALTIYAFGKNFGHKGSTHSFGRFSDDYYGRMAQAMPQSSELFGTANYMDTFLSSAIAGTGQFSGSEVEARQAALEAGLLATSLNWARFELKVSESKANAATPNWSLKNGAPKNWNEIFAFYYGPEGQHSVYEAVEAHPAGAAINARFLTVLANGQEKLLAETWARGEAAEAAAMLDYMAQMLFQQAMMPEDSVVARASAQGFWLAAAESYEPEIALRLQDLLWDANSNWAALQDLACDDACQAMMMQHGARTDSPMSANSDATKVSCEADMRRVEHEYLDAPICVPANPQRVVAQHLTALELMLMLEMQPVARPNDDLLTALYGGVPDVYDAIQAHIGDLPVFGGFDINVEVILEQDPDLVLLYPNSPVKEQLEAFTHVVETPIPNYGEFDWSVLSAFYADVLGVEDDIAGLLEDYKARVATLLEAKKPEFVDASMVFVQNSAGSNYVGLPGMPMWETMTDGGFVPVATLPTTPDAALAEFSSLVTEISEEEISRLDADVIIMVNGNISQNNRDSSRELIESYRSNPLWQTLHAVQNDLLIPVSVHWQSNGIVSAHAVLDDMFRFFTEGDNVAANPFLAAE